MHFLKIIYNNIVNGTKKALLKNIIRREPVIIKDVESNLLKGKTALITGGNSGIGYAIAKKFVESGAKVIILGRNPEKTKSIAKGLHCEYIIADVMNTEKMMTIVDEYINNQRIDILVNSAGVLDKEPMLAKTPKGYDTVMNTNLKAAYFMSQLIANHMLSKGIKGHILNISSSSSHRPGW